MENEPSARKSRAAVWPRLAALALLLCAVTGVAAGTSFGATPVTVKHSELSSGLDDTCAVITGGGVDCWGNGYDGQLGNGIGKPSTTPVKVVSATGLLTGATAVASTQYSNCALLTGGAIDCWGRNAQGQLGTGNLQSSNQAVPVVLGTNVATKIVGGDTHMCALMSDQTVWCWGYDAFGQLGDGGTSQSDVPVKVQGLPSAATDIAAGGFHSCAVLTTGVYCWGEDNFGQTGQQGIANTTVPALVTGTSSLGTSTVTQIAAGEYHTCGVTTTATVVCWGYDLDGELGNGSQTSLAQAVKVIGVANAVQVSAGKQHTCALEVTGAVYCWGSDFFSQLGRLGPSSNAYPAAATVPSASEVDAGSESTCVVLSASPNAIECLGGDYEGELGNGKAGFADLPQAVSGVTGANAARGGLSSGLYYACSLVAAGAKCWGLGQSGQLGVGSSATWVSAITVTGSLGYKWISAGNDDSCAISGSTNQLVCWGSGYNGGLGNGSNTTVNGNGSSLPEAMPGMTGVSEVDMGAYFGCALVATSVKCWGFNNLGQLGIGNQTSQYTPVALPLSPVVHIAVGTDHACAIVGTATVNNVYCWGDNSHGELGDNTMMTRTSPVEVTGLSNVAAITAGQTSSCALLNTGGVDCWGDDTYGQIGVDTGTIAQAGQKKNYPLPQPVLADTTGTSDLANVASISGFGWTNCALMLDKTVECWGYGGDGQGGNGTQVHHGTPVHVLDPTGSTNLSGVQSISAGFAAMCAVTSGNTIDCWGYNQYGTLGNGLAGTYVSPQPNGGLDAA